MRNGATLADRKSTRGVGGGLLWMALFTAMWAGWAYSSWGGLWIILTVAFWCAAIVFAVVGILERARTRHLPAAPIQSGSDDRSPWFGRIFTLEGIFIGAACGALGKTGHFQYICPAVALVVGLHFLPLAWVFRRRVDIWMSGVTVLVALAGLVAVGRDTVHYSGPWGWVAYVCACVTATYGVVMLQAVRQR